jgi:hypothetical protein|tara:strand:+ start:787 stop:981 length:195 start_codon:yes stop_codon:yes gene_type:complete
MPYLQGENYYDDLFECDKGKKAVERHALLLLKNRDKQIYKLEQNIISIAEGHKALISSLMNQIY